MMSKEIAKLLLEMDEAECMKVKEIIKPFEEGNKMLKKALEQALEPGPEKDKNELIQEALEETRKQRILIREIQKNVKGTE